MSVISDGMLDNRIAGNYIETDVSGILALGDASNGVDTKVGGNTIVYKGFAGVSGGDDTSRIHGDSIVGNTDGVTTGSGGFVINARQNSWETATGPTHAGNPCGTGDSAVDGVSAVDYAPWHVAAHAVYS